MEFSDVLFRVRIWRAGIFECVGDIVGLEDHGIDRRN
jgi:hypothetical protein